MRCVLYYYDISYIVLKYDLVVYVCFYDSHYDSHCLLYICIFCLSSALARHTTHTRVCNFLKFRKLV